MKVSSVIQIILFRSIAISGKPTFDWCELIDDEVAVIPDGTEKIPDLAFTNCPGPFSIMIPASVNTIGVAAFSKGGALLVEAICGLKSIDFEANSRLSEIGDSAFANCKALKKIILPASVTSIGNGAFGDSGLTSISFDDDSLLEEIGHDAFYGCRALESVTLPASVRSIGDRAFVYSGLTSISFDDDSLLKVIGHIAFKGCKLKNIALPKSVITIGMNAFKDCKELTKFRIPVGVTTIGNGAFKGCNKLKRLNIPTEYLATRLLR